MKLLASIAVTLGCMSAIFAASAFAQQEVPRGSDLVQGRRHGHGHGGMHQLLPGQNESRVSRNLPEQRLPTDTPAVQPVTEQRIAQDPPPPPGRERLTPEERRQLRRDINAAGRDIYRHTRSE